MAKSLSGLIGKDFLYFYDAVSPVITADSIDMTKAFAANRYGKGTPDYLNCSMSRDEYGAFYEFLTNAECVDPHDFERGHFFEGCMPVEEIARRGEQTLLFGPMKPVGLDDNASAVVQLRKENSDGTLYSLVGFQTRLKWGEQKKLVRMIPGLENAEIVRYGVMHRNIFIDSPRALQPSFQLKSDPRIFFAGQITGVEGYTESTASGLLAGLNAYRYAQGEEDVIPPPETVIGSLVKHITDEEISNFQPMNANFGIMPELNIKAKKKDRKLLKVNRAVKAMDEWMERYCL
jgi:methylenetetrahydrofolate--tRNA-(uracil-5-)-methyltransferase